MKIAKQTTRQKKRTKWLAGVLAYRTERKDVLFDVDVQKVRRKPPHWLLENSEGVTALLQKRDRSSLRTRRWRVLVQGGGLLVFNSRREAIQSFGSIPRAIVEFQKLLDIIVYIANYGGKDAGRVDSKNQDETDG